MPQVPQMTTKSKTQNYLIFLNTLKLKEVVIFFLMFDHGHTPLGGGGPALQTPTINGVRSEQNFYFWAS